MKYTHLLFDLDDTLYASGNGLWEAIRERMSAYMAERLGIPPQRVEQLRREYYQRYGTTLRGLQLHFHVDVDDYLAYVHDLPLERYIKPERKLRALIHSLPQEKWVFTNADAGHARRVLRVLELEDCFKGIIDVRAVGFIPKPEPLAYQRALKVIGEPPPEKCVLFDDSLSNLETAFDLGFVTVWVSSGGEDQITVDFKITSLLELPHAMPDLWNHRLAGEGAN